MVEGLFGEGGVRSRVPTRDPLGLIPDVTRILKTPGLFFFLYIVPASLRYFSFFRAPLLDLIFKNLKGKILT